MTQVLITAAIVAAIVVAGWLVSIPVNRRADRNRAQWLQEQEQK